MEQRHRHIHGSEVCLMTSNDSSSCSSIVSLSRVFSAVFIGMSSVMAADC